MGAYIPAWIIGLIHEILIAIGFPGTPPPPFH
jgi:hypothetical protein